jgi:outer membrane protein
MLPARSFQPSRRRSSRLWAAVFGGALATGALAWSAPAQAQMKLAVVDVRRAVLETEEGLRVTSSLKKLFDSRQIELDAKNAQLQKDKEALDKEIQANKTDKATLQKKLENLQKNAAEIQKLTYDYQREMSGKENELTTPILNKILGILKRIAATDGYDMIVDKSVVPYFRSDLELTDKAIQMYNAGSPDTGKTTPAPDNKTPVKPGSPATTPAPAPAPAPKAGSTGAAPSAPAPAPKK